MKVRDLNFLDWPTIQRWHERSGFNYPLPSLDQEAFAAAHIVHSGAQPVGAALARVTVEIYGFCDPDWGTPAMRLEVLRLLHVSIEKEMKKQKIRTAHAWLPPQLAKSFGRKLVKFFGWYSPDPSWPCFSKDVF
jgi:hypothetical protein